MGHGRDEDKNKNGDAGLPPTLQLNANPTNDSGNVVKQGAFQSRNQSTGKQKPGSTGPGGGVIQTSSVGPFSRKQSDTNARNIPELTVPDYRHYGT